MGLLTEVCVKGLALLDEEEEVCDETEKETEVGRLCVWV